MANIGSLAVGISANAQGFTSELTKTARQAEQWAAQVGKALSLHATFAGGGAGLLTAGAGAIGGATAAFAADVKDRIGKIAEVKREAITAGVSISDFMKLTGKLGAEDTARATAGLSRMARNLHELATGSKEVETKFQAIGFDTAALKEMSVADATREVAKRFAEANTAVEKAGIVFAAFGKSGAEMIPVLEKMRDTEIGGKFKGLTSEDVFAAAEAKKAMAEGGKIWENVKDRVAVEASHVALVARDLFAGDFKLSGVGRVKAEAAAEAARLQDPKAIQAAEQAAKLAKALSESADAAKKFSLSLTAANPFANPLTPFMNRFEAFREEQLGKFKEAGGPIPDQAIENLNKLKFQAFQKDIQGFNASLLKQVEAFELQAQAVGKSAAQVATLKAKLDALRANPDQNLAVANAFRDNLEKLEKAARLAEAAQLKQDARSPLKVFTDQIRNLAGADIGKDVLATLAAKDFVALKQSIGSILPGQLEAPHALAQGTSEAVSEELRFQRQGLAPQNTQEEVKAILSAAKDIQAAQLQKAQEILDAIKNIPADVIPAGDLGL